MGRDRKRGYRRRRKGRQRKSVGETGRELEELEESRRKRKSWGGTEREVIEGEERRRTRTIPSISSKDRIIENNIKIIYKYKNVNRCLVRGISYV